MIGAATLNELKEHQIYNFNQAMRTKNQTERSKPGIKIRRKMSNVRNEDGTDKDNEEKFLLQKQLLYLDKYLKNEV